MTSINNTFRIVYLKYVLLACILILQFSCSNKINKSLTTSKAISYCDVQARKTVENNSENNLLPVVIDSGNVKWNNNKIYDWRSGFWPGIEWYLFESTKNEYWKKQAEKKTEELIGILERPVFNHDLGFQLYCSYGNGYRLTGNENYKKILLRAADSLVLLYNPTVGTILSWPQRVKVDNWSHHTIIDNMMNLELLFWAAKNGGNKDYYNIAVRHATVTMQNHFRPDFSSYHVLFYDDKTGKQTKAITYQGYADNSMWARGQGWAIYGFTMCYRETGNKAFLETANKAADIYLKKLPKDHIPYWDFFDPKIPNAPRDASAAALVASALLELSTLCEDAELQKKYKEAAVAMLNELSSNRYLSKEKNYAFLLHSTGNKPAGREIDISIIYADYYYIEALLRLQKMK
jgi:unsaturated chondroitin disaccharide hydrolase